HTRFSRDWSSDVCSSDLLPDADTAAWPVVNLVSRSFYLVPWTDGRIAVGPTREPGTGFAERTTLRGIHDILAGALAVAPGLEEGIGRAAWRGGRRSRAGG